MNTRSNIQHESYAVKQARIAANVKRLYVPPKPYISSHFPADFGTSDTPLPESTEPTLVDCHPNFASLWNKRRFDASQIADVYALSELHAKLASRIERCSSVLAFREGGVDSDGVVSFDFDRTHSCGARHCPICAPARSRKNVRTALCRLPAIEEENPSLQWLLLTLTVKDPKMADLSDQLVQMNKAWGRLTKRKCWPAVGWIRTTEVTRDTHGDPHPHFHVILCVPKSYWLPANYINGGKWLKLWRQAMRDNSITQVDIRKVGERSTPAWYVPTKDETPQQRALKYTLKYATKAAETIKHPEFLYGITDELKGKRFLASGGILKSIFRRDRPELSEEDKEQLMLIAQKADAKVTARALNAFESRSEKIDRHKMIVQEAKAKWEAVCEEQEKTTEEYIKIGQGFKCSSEKEPFNLPDDKKEYFGPQESSHKAYLYYRSRISIALDHFATCRALKVVCGQCARAELKPPLSIEGAYFCAGVSFATDLSNDDAIRVRDALIYRAMRNPVVERATKRVFDEYSAYRRLLIGSEVQQLMIKRQAQKDKKDKEVKRVLFEWRHREKIFRRCAKPAVLIEEDINSYDRKHNKGCDVVGCRICNEPPDWILTSELRAQGHDI